MRRYRLTFDPNPKELARRDAGIGSHVVLLWSRRTGRAAVGGGHRRARRAGRRREREPARLFHYPYAYMSLRGHSGLAIRQAELAAA